MKKELFIHFFSLVVFFILITFIKSWFDLSYWPFWLGGLFGTILPDVDHFIYIYYLKPQELTSQRVNYLIEERNIRKSLELLYETRYERSNLIFHSLIFQLIFLILTLFVITSSGSIFGRGLVMAFSLHILVDQITDLKQMGNLNNWLKYLPFELDMRKNRMIITFNLLALMLFALLI